MLKQIVIQLLSTIVTALILAAIMTAIGGSAGETFGANLTKFLGGSGSGLGGIASKLLKQSANQGAGGGLTGMARPEFAVVVSNRIRGEDIYQSVQIVERRRGRIG